MPARHDIDIKAKLLITTWEGEAVDIEFIEAIKKYQKNIQSNSAYFGFNEIVNLTGAAKIKITIKGIKNISSIARETDQDNVRTKLAIIVNSKLAFNLASLYATYRSINKKSNKTVRVFNEEKDAFEWAKQ